MPWTLITGPITEPVTLEQARSHLRIDVSDEDDLLEDYLAVCREALELQYDLAFIQQTWDFTIDNFPGSTWMGQTMVWSSGALPIVLTKQPLISVSSVKYIDSTGATQTMASSDYVVDTVRCRIIPAYGKVWPAVALQPISGVIVRCVLGYGANASSVPRSARHAIRLMLGHYYENREQVLLEQRIRPIDIPRGIQDLMKPLDWRIFAA